MLQSLRHYWRSNLAVTLGAAVAAAVLTGALVVGDSVRDSLRRLTEERLGEIESALVVQRLLREELAGDLASELDRTRSETRLDAGVIVPALLLQGSAVQPGSGARASDVAIIGLDERFDGLFPESAPLDFERREGQLFPSVVLNWGLADELGAAVGDELVLSFRRATDIPEETLVGREDETERVESLRLAVAAVIPDRGVGSFGLRPHQSRPHNAFVELNRLQRALDARGEVNALLATDRVEALAPALARVATAEDLGLHFRRPAAGSGDEPGDGALVVESAELVLAPHLAEQIAGEARALDAAALPVYSYLANSLRVVERAQGSEGEAPPATARDAVPYSTVAAFEPPADDALGRFRLTDGSPAPALAEGEILLNAWAAEDLGAAPGDTLAMTYYQLGPRDELSTAERRFRLRGVVALEGLGADPTLTPDFPGMADADDMAAWDPPFPVELDKIGARDEQYWDLYHAAPKAFVSLAEGRALWQSRFGDTTSIRVAAASAAEAQALEPALTAALKEGAGVDAFGLTFRAVRQQGLAAAAGATDFSGLFLAFSQFLIVAAALLVGLLFRLGVEQRAQEVGLLRAVGFRARSVRRRFLTEGVLLAMAGSLLGLAGAVAYAGAMLAGLRGRWLPAVGTPALTLSVRPVTLAIGWVIAVLVVLATIWWSLRKLGKLSAVRLLAGSVEAPVPARRRGRWARWLALAFGLGAAALLAAGFAWSARPSPGLAFGTGVCLLIAGLALFALYCSPGAGHGSENRLGGLLPMAARNSARNRGRSLLSAALIASACFVIVSVGAFRGGGDIDATDRASGTGGFTLVAESDVPLIQDLGRPAVRAELGFAPETKQALAGVSLVPLRLLPGEDASCLNLYAPTEPRVLGVPPELIARGGFAFKATTAATPEEVADPWTLLDQELPAEPDGATVVPAFGDFNSVMWILHSGLGQDLVYLDESGRELRLRLVGLLDGSIFQSELLISEAAFTRHFPSRAGYSVFLIEAAPERAAAVATALESSLTDFGFDATSTADRIASFKAVEHTYISTFQTIGGLGLLLGTLGLGVVLLRNVLERRGELATLRAFGFRRARITRMVVAENVFLLAVGIAIGAGAALLSAAPQLVHGADPPPWLSLAATLAAVFLVGLLASLAAVRRALRFQLLPLLKGE
jgi:ABC-type antimicrobial peptide transport system permease subunit